MPERSIDTGIWEHEDFQQLTPLARLLHIYLFSNSHCNQAGLYKITPITIAFETGIPITEVEPLLEALKPLKIIWYPETKLVWVKNFVRRQCHAPKFLIAVAKCLGTIHDQQLVTDYLAYNRKLGIPYQYPIDRLSIPGKGKGLVLVPGMSTGNNVLDNTELDKIDRGGREVLEPGKSNTVQTAAGQPAARSPDGKVMDFYLNNMGELTPQIAGWLDQACLDFTEEWVYLALKEAVRSGKTGWNYVDAILKSWREKGYPASDKKHKKRGAERFTTGRYAHVVKH